MKIDSELHGHRGNDTIVQTRISRIPLATVATYFKQQGEYLPTLSALARRSIEVLAEVLVDRDLAPKILSVNDATETLQRAGIFTNLNPSGRAKFTLLTELEKEDRILERASFEPDTSITDAHGKEVVDELTKVALEIQSDPEKMRKIMGDPPSGAAVDAAAGASTGVGSGIETLAEGQARREREQRKMKENHEKMLANLRKGGEENAV